MVIPSAPTLGSVTFEYFRPIYRAPKGELLETDEEKHELCDATDELLAGLGFLRGVEMNFCNGSVILTVQSQHDPEYSGTLLLDVVATKFFRDNQAYIASINPSLAFRIENNVLTKDVRKISDIFYRTYQRYLEEYTNEEGTLDNLVDGGTIISSKPGFKNFYFYAHHQNRQVASLDTLKEAAGRNFKKFIQTLPISLLSHKGSKKAVPFLQAGLDQKTSYEDKLLYLKQVLFLLTFQDAFKNILQNMQQSIAIEKHALYTSPNRDHNISEKSQYLQKRLELLETTLSQLPVNDVAMLIPLACRSSLDELSQDDDFFENGNSIETEYLTRECGNARRADIVIRQVLEDSFHVTPKIFSVKDDHLNEEGMESIESYLMGISGLAISPGLMGRLAMKDHHTIYYKRTPMFSIDNVSDNFPIEFLLTATQFYPGTNDDWIEEKCLGYVIEMMGRISLHELDAIKAKIQHVRQAVQRAPVDTLLKQRSTNQHFLRNSAIEKLQSLYKIAREEVGLQPLPDTHSSSCSIM